VTDDREEPDLFARCADLGRDALGRPGEVDDRNAQTEISAGSTPPTAGASRSSSPRTRTSK
jgi:hypothetical protein